jgi:hypothetical protein
LPRSSSHDLETVSAPSTTSPHYGIAHIITRYSDSLLGDSHTLDGRFGIASHASPNECYAIRLAGFHLNRLVDCTLDSCQNGGTCVQDPANGIDHCACTAGFAGLFCSVSTSTFSTPFACLNGGTPTYPFGNFATTSDPTAIIPQCLCPQFFYGNLCETRFTQCEQYPCLNNGTCDPNAALLNRCTCLPFYIGEDCGTFYDPCDDTPCFSGGTCNSTDDDVFTCTCPAGFTGSVCRNVVNFCESDPCSVDSDCITSPSGYTCICPSSCENGGVCVASTGVCNCTDGYTGTFCDEVDYCYTNPCQNNGICYISSGLPHRNCSCVSGFTGESCELDFNECESSPCMLGATCVNGMDNYTCDCGCQNGATCITFFGLCLCPSGFLGTYCEQNVNECESSPCAAATMCVDQANAYTCDCGCQNGGVCDSVTGVCTCLAGFLGTNCSINIDECASNPCLASATCVDQANAYTCDCGCHNGGVCNDTTGLCDCLNGFMGNNCSVNIDDCASNPCLASATCVDQINAYTCNCGCHNGGTCNTTTGLCACLPGYSGNNCSVNIDECASNPCLASATCVDQVNAYTCNCGCQNGATCWVPNGQCLCPAGFAGTYCAVNVNECESSPCVATSTCVDQVNAYTCNCGCQNGGTCNAATGVCACLPGYAGNNCSVNINECASNPCQSFSTCVDQINAYTCNCGCQNSGTCNTINGTCTCPSGFLGPRCSSPNPCTASLCRNGGTCSVSSITLVSTGLPTFFSNCTCTPEFFGARCENNVTAIECTSAECQAAISLTSLQPSSSSSVSSIITTLNSLANDTEAWRNTSSSGAIGTVIADKLTSLSQVSKEESLVSDDDLEVLAKVTDALFEPETVEKLASTSITVSDPTDAGEEQTRETLAINRVSAALAALTAAFSSRLNCSVVNNRILTNVRLNIARANNGSELASDEGFSTALGLDVATAVSPELVVAAIDAAVAAALSIDPSDPTFCFDRRIIVYMSSVPFKSINPGKNEQVISPVIGLDFGSESLSVKDLSEDERAKFTFQVSADLSDPAVKARARCAYWSTDTDTWRTDGCELTIMDNGTASCVCTHLTNFAILLRDPDSMDNLLSDTEAQALTAVTYAGCSLSILGCLACIAVFMAVPKLLTVPIKLILQLCVALAAANLVFLAGVMQTKSSATACTAVAILLYYFLLVCFTCMACLGHKMYRDIVVVFSDPVRLRTYLCITWIGPAVATAVVAAVDFGAGSRPIGFGNGSSYCWISTDWGKLGAFLIPLAVVVAANLYAFARCVIVILRSLKTRSQLGAKSQRSQSADVGIFFAILVTLGLTWGFAYLALTSVSVFLYLFVICNSLQGALIFLLHACRGRVYREWSTLFRSKLSVLSPSAFASLSTSSGRGARKKSAATTASTSGGTCVSTSASIMSGVGVLSATEARKTHTETAVSEQLRQQFHASVGGDDLSTVIVSTIMASDSQWNLLSSHEEAAGLAAVDEQIVPRFSTVTAVSEDDLAGESGQFYIRPEDHVLALRRKVSQVL